MNIESLTMKELAVIEAKSKQSFGDFGKTGVPQAQLMTAMAWVLKKKDDPTFTYEQAQDTPLSALKDLLGVEDEDAEDDPDE